MSDLIVLSHEPTVIFTIDNRNKVCRPVVRVRVRIYHSLVKVSTFFNRATLCISAVFTVVRCPSCLSVTLVECIYTAQDIVKLLVRSDSPIDPMRRYPIPGERNIHGVGKIAIFDCNHRLSRKQYEIGPYSCYGTLIESWMVDRSVSVPMIFSDL